MPTPVRQWSDIRPAVAKVMADRGVTLGKLHDWTGLGRSTLQGAIYGNTDTQWNTAAKILTALGLDLTWVQTVAANSGKRRPTKGGANK